MPSLLHRLRASGRASMPSVPTDDAVAATARIAYRRSDSDPARRRRRSVETWLRKALPASSGPPPPAPVPSTARSALRRRKRDFMRSALARVFVKHRPEDLSAYVDASTPPASGRHKWLVPVAPASVPWEDEPASYSSVEDEQESYCNRSSYGFPPFLKAEEPTSEDDQSEEEEEEEEEEVPAFVVPPVQIPPSYRKQDRAGGTMVAGSVVLFTRLAFKRRLLRQGRRLAAIPEAERLDAVRFATVCNYSGLCADGVLVASVRV